MAFIATKFDEDYQYEHQPPPVLREGEKGYINNCLVDGREGDDILFEVTKDGWIPYLNGYAIIPMEKYVALCRSYYDSQTQKKAA